MRPLLYLEGVNLKKIIKKPVYVCFLKIDNTRLGFLYTKTSKKGSLPSFLVSRLSFIFLCCLLI